MRLTPASIRSLTLPPGKADAVFWDSDISGFGVRLRSNSAPTFVFQYRLGKKQRRMKLEDVSAVTLADTRKVASRLHSRVALGEDPAGDKAAARLATAETFAALSANTSTNSRTATGRLLRPTCGTSNGI